MGLFYTHFYNGFFNLMIYMGTPEINTYRYKSFFLNIHIIVHSKIYQNYSTIPLLMDIQGLFPYYKQY